MKHLIAETGFAPLASCKCDEHAAEMDRQGPDWCEKNIDLICQWLKHESRSVGLPFVKLLAVQYIREAISISRGSQS